MLTNLTVRNFKRFGEVEIELANPVVFIGPNNSGKTTALQALALWEYGVKRWNEKRAGDKKTPKKRPGVVINRRDLIALPVPAANLLWKDLRTRHGQMDDGKQKTTNVYVDVLVDGVTAERTWQCGMEFYYANEESFYCRPLRKGEGKTPERMVIPPEAGEIAVTFLPPMSGLAANETRLDPGAVSVRIGEGRTAEVLRNLCHTLTVNPAQRPLWERLQAQIDELFGVKLEEPVYVAERGEITMAYREGPGAGTRLDLSSSGRGLQQTLLLLAFLYANPRSVLLLDEPDAHLEILRQRQVYQLLTEVADDQGCQVIIASHSEVLLNEAADRDMVVAFVGPPHRIDDRGSQALKSLREIGFDQYYQAEQTGWILYLEGSTDLSILRVFARKLSHRALEHLQRPFAHWVLNQPKAAQAHFHGLREAKADLVGFALYDNLERVLDDKPPLREYQWRRREIENYLCQPETLMAFAEHSARETSGGELLANAEVPTARKAMEKCIRDVIAPVAYRDRSDKWWIDVKASDDFLDRVVEAYYRELGLPNLMRKTNYHVLAEFVPTELIDDEVRVVLDAIVETADRAKPRVD